MTSRNAEAPRPPPPVPDGVVTDSVSVIATVWNEADNIEVLLASLAAQTRRPEEIVIVDGGSSDGTLEILRKWAESGRLPLVVIERPGANISAGRNMAIDLARGPWIASTDAGVRLDPWWLEALTAPLIAAAPGGQAHRISSGFFASDPRGAFETALGATTLPEVADVDPERFLPSSRSVAFHKDDWRIAGGYPEWLDYCEDLVFDFRMLEIAGPAAFVPGAVAHFRPRRDLSSFFRQYFRYARGDGKADLWRLRHAVRYGTYLGLGPALLALGWLIHPVAWGMLAVGVLAMWLRPMRRLTHQWDELDLVERIAAALWILPIRIGGDVAKMLGYPVGWAWRIRTSPPRWRFDPERGS